MATTLTPSAYTRAGLDLATEAAADATGNNWVNSGKEFLYVDNQGAVTCNVTLVYNTTSQTFDGQAVANKVVAVAAGARKIIGPFPTGIYNDVNSKANVSYDQVASVKVLLLSRGANDA
jgi:hypothetical protein